MATPPTTQSSSSQEPKRLFQTAPNPHPIHVYLSRAVAGHAAIVAAIAAHRDRDAAREQAIGQLHDS